jgi:hypothetical protein
VTGRCTSDCGTNCGQRSLRRNVRKALTLGSWGRLVEPPRCVESACGTQALQRVLPFVCKAEDQSEKQMPTWKEAPCACPGTQLTTICRPRDSHSCGNTVRRSRSRWLPLVVTLLLVMAAKTDGTCPQGMTGSGEHSECNAPRLARFLEQSP